MFGCTMLSSAYKALRRQPYLTSETSGNVYERPDFKCMGSAHTGKLRTDDLSNAYCFLGSMYSGVEGKAQ